MKNFISDESLEKLIAANSNCGMITDPEYREIRVINDAPTTALAIIGGSATEHEIAYHFIDAQLAVETQKGDTSING